MGNVYRLLTLCVIATFTSNAGAYQLLQIREDKPVMAQISAKDPSRIAIKNGKIKFIRVKEEELSIEPDKELGEVTILPKSESQNISIFVVDDQNKTYSVVLQQADIPAENIVLDTGASDKSLNDLLSKERPEPLPSKNYAYEKKISAMLEFMAGKPKETSAVEVKTIVPQEIKLWKDTRFFKVGSYKGQTGIYRGIGGEKYRLFNVSTEKLVIEEAEFFKDGVAGISVETLELEPNMSTFVYIIKAEVPNE